MPMDLGPYDNGIHFNGYTSQSRGQGVNYKWNCIFKILVHNTGVKSK